MLPDWYVSLTCMSEVLTGVGWSFRGVEEEGGVCVCGVLLPEKYGVFLPWFVSVPPSPACLPVLPNNSGGR